MATRFVASRRNISTAGLMLAVAVLGRGAEAEAGPSVTEHYGNIEYHQPVGAGESIRALTSGGNYGEPTLSPDGRTVAFVHIDQPSSDAYEGAVTSLWIADGPTGAVRRVVRPEYDENADMRSNLVSLAHPVFSLNGEFVYVNAALAAVTPAVHQIDVTTGAQRFVIDGSLKAVIRTGPYRGYLIVGRRIEPTATAGAHDAAYVVRPDGTLVLMIPGSDQDDLRDHTAAWLNTHGWQAW